MTRQNRQPIDLGEGATRYSTVLRDVPSEGPGVQARRFQFLQELAHDGLYNGLLNCGPVPFDTLRIRHDGEAWVAEIEATEHIHH